MSSSVSTLGKMTDHLVGVAELSELLGVTRQRAIQIADAYEDFPAPQVVLASGRIWARAEVEEWVVRHPDRRPGRPRGATTE